VAIFYNGIQIGYRDSDNLGCFYCGVFGRFAATALFTSNIRSGTTSCQSSTTATQQQIKNLDCPELGRTLGGISVPSGNVCDVVLVRKSPEIMGHNGLVMNKFTLMNSVLEFMAANATNTTSSSQSPSDQNVYVMGDFALLESEMNPVLQVLTNAGWTVTGVHNHMMLESPKTTFMHWETQGDLNTIIGQIKDALAKTSIQGPQ
jgi:hypothetical protein